MWKEQPLGLETVADARTGSGDPVLQILGLMCLGWSSDALKYWGRNLPWFWLPPTAVIGNLKGQDLFSFVEADI